MQILETSGWEDYELIDSGNGKRLERFGKYILSRPDPQTIWQPKAEKQVWNRADAIFDGSWKVKGNIPDKWLIKYHDVSLYLKLTPFKHTGVFPEQKAHWDFILQKILSAKNQPNILNLFGYTGAISLLAAQADVKVTHLDASKPAISWFRENQKLSNLMDRPIRIIADDAIKFTGREIKRGVKYDAIIMDPPVYGHDPEGRVWDFGKNFPTLMQNCSKILSSDPLFVIVNTYAISASAIMLGNVMNDYLGNLGGQIEVGELCLKEKTAGRLLSTGIFGKWSK
ncbi:MAG: hypothetical protein UU32_C0032G0004 [Candidatus Woesebacteria bacterium GW2011_GWB1_41_10]|uniref:Methyltransferase small domain-containing protein n=1 Tax=Candidatus Woesebacteria bacterium GW2011_GWB1_41_10 TaxID=1618577 RepID=A0A0G0WMZ9_9BACT|nr:MAG: hypothetical protein UU32_C0032G0004 [Candidatus Woesebacteria bacterium GW2011_GWB1_41_10]